MSCDFGVWFPHKRLSAKEASELYARLCDELDTELLPHPAVDSFYEELTARHPEIDSIDETRIGEFDYCPWSCAMDRSAGHVIMCCVWSKADYVDHLVHELGRKHGLAVYDPQLDKITYPDDPPKSDRPWWRFW